MTIEDPTHASIAWQDPDLEPKSVPDAVSVPPCRSRAPRKLQERPFASRQTPGGLLNYLPADPSAGICGCSSVGRASAFQAECRGFEPLRPLQRHLTFQVRCLFSFGTHPRIHPVEKSAHIVMRRTPTGSIVDMISVLIFVLFTFGSAIENTSPNKVALIRSEP